jgi:hypothetical protein
MNADSILFLGCEKAVVYKVIIHSTKDKFINTIFSHSY